jgi:hypothetical protein
MDPPLSHLAPSGHASLLTLRISRSLFPNVGHRVGTDHGAQSDETDAASIDSDRAKPRAPDATGIVRPLRVKSVSEPERMRRPLAALASDALPAWATFTRGSRRAGSPKRGYRNRPWDRRNPGICLASVRWPKGPPRSRRSLRTQPGFNPGNQAIKRFALKGREERANETYYNDTLRWCG